MEKRLYQSVSVEIYNKYNLKGLDFIPLPKSPHYFLLRCNNIVRYDYDYNTNLYMKDKCPTCNQWYEICPQGILNIRMEDEAIMEADTFYVSDIIIGEKCCPTQNIVCDRQYTILF